MRNVRSHPNPALPKVRLTREVPHPSTAYRVFRVLLQAFSALIWKMRAFNRHHEPAAGGVLYISNHQSFLDPILATAMLQRPCNYMARDSLFRNPVFKWMIETVNAFPVKRGTADTGAIKEAMRRLKNGHCVVVFAEGTRTRDGRIAGLLPGVALLAQRAAAWTVPVVIDGAFEAWPRSSKLPGSGNIVVQYGTPLAQADIRKRDPAEILADIRTEMIAIQTDLRRRVGRPPLEY